MRYAGIFAAHARGRYALTGRGLHDRPAAGPAATTRGAATPGAAPVPTAGASSPSPATPSPSAAPAAPGSSNQAVDLQQQDAAYESDADLVGPDDPERARRLTWASLFTRVWREDVLRCSKCGGEMRLIAVVQDSAVCERILRHLGLWQRGPPRGRHVVVEPADHEPPDVN